MHDLIERADEACDTALEVGMVLNEYHRLTLEWLFVTRETFRQLIAVSAARTTGKKTLPPPPF